MPYITQDKEVLKLVKRYRMNNLPLADFQAEVRRHGKTISEIGYLDWEVNEAVTLALSKEA